MPFIGEIRAFPYKYAPIAGGRWVPCNGARVAIREHTELYSVIGDKFGPGDGASFQLPDLQGRIAAGTGAGPNLTARELGESWGEAKVALTYANLPTHRHHLTAETSTVASQLSDTPAATYAVSRTINQFNYDKTLDTDLVTLHSDAIGWAGAPVPAAHENCQPILAVTYFICSSGGDYPFYD